MGQSDLLRHATGVLERLSIPYLITGSVASAAYGEPRFTNDIDIVAVLDINQVEEFCAGFPAPDFYCSVDAARTAVLSYFQFNILHPASGLKIDIMVPDKSEFNQTRLNRGLRLQASADLTLTFASPEDVILKKLEYYREGKSEKHVRDITGIVKIRGASLDGDYVQYWANRLGLAQVWRDVQQAMKSN